MSYANATYEYEKYITTKETLKETLEEFGVAIIPSVLNPDECEELLNGLWNFFEHITKNWETPVSRHNTDSWKQIYSLYPIHSMLFQHWNIGHSQAVWDARQNEKIVDIFSHFWNCENNDLLVSFDGASFHVPPEFTSRGWNRFSPWFHTDQSYTRNEFECVQSWITAVDVEDGDATLAIMEGSHKYHKECAETFELNNKDDWYKLNGHEQEFYDNKRCEYKKIKCPKGSLVLWDSRTIHCGVESSRSRNNPHFRAVIYLCYQPRSMCSKANIKKKQKAFNELRMTTHWPSSKIKLFPKTPRTYGGKLPITDKIDPPNITDLGRTLAGF